MTNKDTKPQPRKTPMLDGKPVLPAVPTCALPPPADPEVVRLAELTDRQLLAESRKMLKKEGSERRIPLS